MNSGVYCILNTISGKRYVGSTVNCKQRKTEHWAHLRRGDHYNRYLQAAWTKHGEAAFAFIIIEEVPPERLLDVEQIYLDSNHDGYNLAHIAGKPGLSPGWPLGKKRTWESRRKMSESHRGIRLSPEHRAAQSRGKKGKPGRIPSAATRALWSRQRRGRKSSAEVIEKRVAPLRGRSRSEELKAKISVGLKRYWATRHVRSQSPETKEKKRIAMLRHFAARKVEIPQQGSLHSEVGRTVT